MDCPKLGELAIVYYQRCCVFFSPQITKEHRTVAAWLVLSRAQDVERLIGRPELFSLKASVCKRVQNTGHLYPTGNELVLHGYFSEFWTFLESEMLTTNIHGDLFGKYKQHCHKSSYFTI